MIRKEYFIYLILLIAALLLFTNLSDNYLWEDEAETAVISRNILKHFWPVAYDGINLVTQEWGHDSNTSYIWIHQSWLPHYVTALSFLVFGISTWSARILYVLFALLTIYLLYYFVYKEKKDLILALSSAALLTTSVTFLLHARQCRYYSLLILLAMVWIFVYWKLVNNKNTIVLPVIIGVLLFNTQYVAASALILATLFAGIIVQKRISRDAVKTFAGIFLLCLPWIIYTKLWTKFSAEGISLVDRLVNWAVKLGFNIINLNHFIFPLVLLLIIFYWYFKNKFNNFDKYFLLAGIFYLVIASYSPLYPDIRYMIVLIPWATYLLARVFNEVYKKNKVVAAVFLISLVFINIWSMPFWVMFKNILPEKLNKEFYKDIRMDFVSYIKEITHKTSGPIKATVEYINKNGEKDQTIFTNYGAEPYIFYTNKKIIREIPFKENPDWIILKGTEWPKWIPWVLIEDKVNNIDIKKRYIWNYHRDKENGIIWQKRKHYIVDFISKNKYRKIVLNAENRLWENRPTLLRHSYGSDLDNPKIVIYKKI